MILGTAEEEDDEREQKEAEAREIGRNSSSHLPTTPSLSTDEKGGTLPTRDQTRRGRHLSPERPISGFNREVRKSTRKKYRQSGEEKVSSHQGRRHGG